MTSTLNILSIPPELLSHVLSFLPYGDLYLRVPLVCRLFHSLIGRTHSASSTPIDKILWRDAPATTAPKIEYDLHPLLRYNDESAPFYLEYDFKPSIEDVDVFFRNHAYSPLEQSTKLIDHPLAHENCCRPSVRKVVYHRFRSSSRLIPVGSITIIGTGNNGGVTVLDVMQGIAEGIAEDKLGKRSRRTRWDGIEKWKWEECEGEGVVGLYDLSHRGGLRGKRRRVLIAMAAAEAAVEEARAAAEAQAAAEAGSSGIVGEGPIEEGVVLTRSGEDLPEELGKS